RTKLPAGRAAELLVTQPHDFEVVLLDGRQVGPPDRMRRERSLRLPERREEATPDLIVEPMVQVSFGPDMEPKWTRPEFLVGPLRDGPVDAG
ncbi:MAG: hypothetical protein ACKO3N_10430, partial [Verrucomicrobiota bacterium]